MYCVPLSLKMLSVNYAQHRDIGMQWPTLSLSYLHTQVFPPFRLIPRKVTLIIGAMIQVGAKGYILAPLLSVARHLQGSSHLYYPGFRHIHLPWTSDRLKWNALGC